MNNETNQFKTYVKHHLWILLIMGLTYLCGLGVLRAEGFHWLLITVFYIVGVIGMLDKTEEIIRSYGHYQEVLDEQRHYLYRTVEKIEGERKRKTRA